MSPCHGVGALREGLSLGARPVASPGCALGLCWCWVQAPLLSHSPAPSSPSVFPDCTNNRMCRGSRARICLSPAPFSTPGGKRRSGGGGRLLSPFKKQEHGMCIRLSSSGSMAAFRLSQLSPPRAFLHKPLLFAAFNQYTGSNSSPDVPYQTQSHANKLWHT